MLIEFDSKPEETIFYIAARLNNDFKKNSLVHISELQEIFSDFYNTHPVFKIQLAIDFLFLLGKVKLEGNVIHYVH
ncbi:ABC-three component system middle component 6 [Psychrobacillus sp.]|uniref:ABC-three component system middle component 6 n=1 Tax=Psychrobacillus sp. TaxID=1871623 RepID=UPI0028BE052C|nr:ABC-three component system middle component 6 [Psychrobacillus sp.]